MGAVCLEGPEMGGRSQGRTEIAERGERSRGRVAEEVGGMWGWEKKKGSGR